MSNEQIANIYTELPREKQEKFIAFLNQLLSEVQIEPPATESRIV